MIDAGLAVRTDWKLPPKADNWHTFLRGLEKRVAQGRVDNALDVLYDRVDDLLLEGAFNTCNALLACVDVERSDETLLLGILTITHAARERLPRRAEFFRQVRGRILRTSPNEAEGLLQGLE